MTTAAEFLAGTSPELSAIEFLAGEPKGDVAGPALDTAKDLLGERFKENVGAAEAGLSTATQFTTGALGYGLGGLAGIIESLVNGKFGTPEGTASAAKRAQANAESATYEPRSEKGKAYNDVIQRLIQDSGVMGINPAVFMGMQPGAAARQLAAKFKGVPKEGVTPAVEAKVAPPTVESTVGLPVEPASDFPIPIELPPAAAKPAAPAKPAAVPKAETKPVGPDAGLPAGADDLETVLPRRAAPAATAEDFLLTGQTEGEAQAEAARVASLEAKPADVPSAEEFLLSGSDSAADQARARGQMELAPAEEPAAPAVETPEAVTPEDIAAEKKLQRQLAAQKRYKEGAQINPLHDDLPTMFGKLGGVSKQALIDLGLDPAAIDPKRGFFRSTDINRPSVRAKGGLSLDAIAEALDDYGFQVRDELGNVDATKVHELLDQHINGERVYAPEGFEHQAGLAEEAKAAAMRTEDEAALEEFGPGTFGANPFLNPKVLTKAVNDTLIEMLGEPGEHRNLFNPIRDAEQHGVARVERWAAGEGADMREAFPTKEARENLTMRIVKNDTAGLTEKQVAAMRKLQANYRAMGEYAQAAERINGLRGNYSPQIWDMADKDTKRIIDTWQAARSPDELQTKLEKIVADTGRDPQSFSPFMLSRSIPDVIEGMKLGLKPKSLDAADLFETYARSISTAVERGKALVALKELQADDGTMMVIPREQAPKNYVKIDNPELEGVRIHPDIAPSVRVLMETNNPGAIAAIWQTLAYTTKRALVSYSFFHPKALAEAWVGTGGNPATMKTAIDAALKAYRDGGSGDDIDKGLGAGLKIGAPLEDVLGRDRFKNILDTTASIADKVGAGKPIKMAKALDEKLQKLTWDYVQTGLKLDTFMRKMNDLRTQQAAKMKKDGTFSKAAYDAMEKSAARQAAEFVNATFGGVNWERMLDNFDTPTARAVMSEILSKQGRSTMQSALFAPDWLVSTVGSWTNAFDAGTQNAMKRQLAQRYLVTSAVVTLTVGNALNYYYTGHSMFENKTSKKDPTWGDRMKAKTEVQLGDGRRMQIAKHFMEVPHAVMDPVQFGLNKLNPTVSEPLEQLFNKQYLTSGGSAPPITRKKDSNAEGAAKRLEHAAGKFLPITGRGILDQGPLGLGGFFGFPVYGQTAEQKAKAKAER